MKRKFRIGFILTIVLMLGILLTGCKDAEPRSCDLSIFVTYGGCGEDGQDLGSGTFQDDFTVYEGDEIYEWFDGHWHKENQKHDNAEVILTVKKITDTSVTILLGEETTELKYKLPKEVKSLYTVCDGINYDYSICFTKSEEASGENGSTKTLEKKDIISLSDEDLRTIERLNESSDLGFEFFETLGKDSRGMISVSTEDMLVRGTGYAYQNVDDDVKLSELHISGGDYNVFEIRVGDSVDYVSRLIANYGFVQGPETVLRTETSMQSFNCGNIYVNFEFDTRTDENKITKINVIADFTKNYDLNLGIE